MSFEDQKCISCGSKNIFKVPSLQEPIREEDYSSRTGKIVDDYIKTAKEEVDREKHLMKSEVK